MNDRETNITILKHLREMIDANYHNEEPNWHGGPTWHTHLFERSAYDMDFYPPTLDVVVKIEGYPNRDAGARIVIKDNTIVWNEFRNLPEGCKDPLAAEVIFAVKEFNISNPTCFEDFEMFVKTHKILIHKPKWIND